METNTLSYFEIAKTPSQEVLAILNDNIIGTPGFSLVYQHQTVYEKIHKIADAYFMNLKRRQRLVGTCCLCRRTTLNRGKEFQSYYIRYFSMKENFRSKAMGQKTSERKSLIRNEIHSILKGNGLQPSIQKWYHYAYVDLKNLRSVRFCKEFGFESVRSYTSLIFNRIYPKQYEQISLLKKEEEVEMKLLLQEFYKSYNMFTFENLFNGRKYYVIRDLNGKVLAGVQVNPDYWKIHQLPGIAGKLLLSTFSSFPYLKNIIRKNYNFLAVDGIYFSEGNEKYLEQLFEGLLSMYELNNAILCLDAQSDLYSSLKKLNLGLVNKINKKSRGNVIMRFVNCSKEESLYFRQYPVYISGIDVT